MLGKRFLQLAWLHVIQAGVYREALEICRSSRMSTSIRLDSVARQVLEHVIWGGMQLAVEERPPRWI